MHGFEMKSKSFFILVSLSWPILLGGGRGLLYLYLLVGGSQGGQTPKLLLQHHHPVSTLLLRVHLLHLRKLLLLNLLLLKIPPTILSNCHPAAVAQPAVVDLICCCFVFDLDTTIFGLPPFCMITLSLVLIPLLPIMSPLITTCGCCSRYCCCCCLFTSAGGLIF